MWEIYGMLGDNGELTLIKVVKTLAEVYDFNSTVAYKIKAYNQLDDEWVVL